ncbi:hypothetical protein NDA01_21520 [Trichocoleus desertorum AS-A10]|uniref:hypothetical protein n=1 Tax=Trichocoleus desertorum TaxID=1481672 RepID=UPI003298B7D8
MPLRLKTAITVNSIFQVEAIPKRNGHIKPTFKKTATTLEEPILIGPSLTALGKNGLGHLPKHLLVSSDQDVSTTEYPIA